LVGPVFDFLPTSRSALTASTTRSARVTDVSRTSRGVMPSRSIPINKKITNKSLFFFTESSTRLSSDSPQVDESLGFGLVRKTLLWTTFMIVCLIDLNVD
jgi:hypothetical protein